MGKRMVTYSAVGGVLRVWNPTPVNVKVKVGEKEMTVSPGCMKELPLPDAAGFEIEGVAGQGPAVSRQFQDGPAEDPLAPDLVATIKQSIADAAAAAGIREMPMGTPDPNLLMGSMVQPSVFDDLVVHTGWDPAILSLDAVIRLATEGEIPAGYRAVQLGDVVHAAYELSGLSIDQWNASAQDRLETMIAETLELLRAEAKHSAGVHHELNLAESAGTKDVMGIPPAPKQQLEVLPDGRILGRRVPDETEWFAPGDYGKLGGRWMANAPGAGLGDLGGHEVTEHEDGTITVSPSIAIDDGRSKWHGYLEAGIWRKA